MISVNYFIGICVLRVEETDSGFFCETGKIFQNCQTGASTKAKRVVGWSGAALGFCPILNFEHDAILRLQWIMVHHLA